MRLKKFFAKLFVVLSTFFVVLSPVVLVEEAHHNCNHEDCQICEVIRTAQETIKHTEFNPVSTTVVVLAPLFLLLVTAIIATIKNKDFTSLVTLKTKLSNQKLP